MTVDRAARALIAAAVVTLAVACTPTEQSPAPTAATASPVQAPPNPQLVEFEGRVADGLKREGQLVRDLAAASTGSQAQLAFVARQMADWSDEELAWLGVHPADPCYQEAAHAYESGLADVVAAAAAFAALAAASGAPDDTAGEAAGESLANGTDSLTKAAALARAARAACT